VISEGIVRAKESASCKSFNAYVQEIPLPPGGASSST